MKRTDTGFEGVVEEGMSEADHAGARRQMDREAGR